MVAAVDIGDGHGLRIEMHGKNQPNKIKLLLYKQLFSLDIPLNGYIQATRCRASVIKVGMVDLDICILSHLK